MNIKLYIDNELFKFSDDELHVKDILLNLQNLNNIAKSDEDVILKTEELYEVEVLEGIKLYEVMYENKGNVSKETRKFLTTLIDRFQTEDSINWNEIRENPRNYRVGFVCLNIKDKSIFDVLNEDDLYRLRVEYLKEIQNENDFILQVQGCFENLYFHENIKYTTKTLSVSIKDYIGMIIKHLSAINYQFLKTYKEHETAGLKEVLSYFQSTTGIKCTLEGDRESTKSRLTFIFKDIKGNDINLVCEPHTKLEGNGKNGDSEFRFDRIYFHQGDSRVAKDKVLIAYIGKHL